MTNIKKSAGYATLQAALDCGVNVCFANPGTTEMPLVAVLDSMPKMRSILGLFEGVCTGAADGYARITGGPALTLLHLGPGFANGIANLHNARRANTPVVNLIGDHASWHLEYDAPLTSDISALAGAVSIRVDKITSNETAAQSMVDVIEASVSGAGGVTTLIHPVDFQYGELEGEVAHGPVRGVTRDYNAASLDQVEAAAARLKQAKSPTLIIGGSALTREGQEAASRIMRATGAKLFSETFPPVAARGGGLPNIDRLPYFPEVAIRSLDSSDFILLASTREPVAYFGYEGIPSELAPKEKYGVLSEVSEDGSAALVMLANAIDAPEFERADFGDIPLDEGALDKSRIGTTIARNIPEGAIVSIEGASCGYSLFTASSQSHSHRVMTNTGGAIGQGLPCALGASIGAPGTPVIALQSDGCGQYTIQALWTMAREEVPVVICLASNQKYAVLQTELKRIGLESFGDVASGLTDLTHPFIDWVKLAEGYGVEAVCVYTAEDLDVEIKKGLTLGKPYLIEMRF